MAEKYLVKHISSDSFIIRLLSSLPLLICISLSKRGKVHEEFPQFFVTKTLFLEEYKSTLCKTLASKEYSLGDAILNPRVLAIAVLDNCLLHISCLLQ